MKLLLFSLILISSFFAFELKHSSATMETMDLSSQSPPASLASREGAYLLVNGTQGCPTSVILFEQCAGFVLDPKVGNAELATEKFCKINRGEQRLNENSKKIKTRADVHENYVHKTEVTQQNNVSTSIESTLIFDDLKKQFLWEHSQNRNQLNKGFSCLYAK